ncbi:hypothetical protein [Aliirhizobium smilacinae]|uniref:Uncharacterized protein n=1 Tax=Aliirhizobium smilacinae TaxID=1395944 RepID=A0A5C4X906_9HYPH|nr:hypothetical protein [Rhizobium smilacinae]TNM59862.1 hypothetical protein FHP24_27195 [Rhizobium smilacinae]
MLIALTNGKAGRVKQDISVGASWRDLFRSSEDLLTASVFGRLSYLEGPMVWKILRRGLGFELPDYKVVELYNVEFWPTWPEGDGAARTVEPDVFLQINVGDPSVQIDLIIEAKLGIGLDQCADQWRRQWTAYHELPATIDGDAKPYLIAIGGLGQHEASYLSRILQDLQKGGHEVKALAANWPKLLEAVIAVGKETTDLRDTRILSDIVSALALAGYRQIQSFSGLTAHHRIDHRSKAVLVDYNFQETHD